ncbi:MAG TPA: bifunctional hydroxymethylpyrimidine kinase/phosphomethylpyrimidine kinase [Acidobacteriota bacterium]|nr:bifunctional hydroxymethylpyrimidine kinase/phosphomethylpyrimidine kinase [Acidobacteriota bacterium]
MNALPRALTIAGSDSGGCAGIQADLKTFGALQVHGMSVITSVTAQNSVQVLSSWDVPSSEVGLQIDAVIEDIGADAVKTGMLSSPDIIRTVTERICRHGLQKLVVDPVMRSTSGATLIQADAIEVLKSELFPLAFLVTPNLPETELLIGGRIRDLQDIEKAAQTIYSLGPAAVLIKGGHSGDPEWSTDYLFEGTGVTPLKAPRINTKNTHGSGCTYSAAITAYLAKGLELSEAVYQAKQFVTEALKRSFSVGSGSGPLCHFYNFWEEHS